MELNGFNFVFGAPEPFQRLVVKVFVGRNYIFGQTFQKRCITVVLGGYEYFVCFKINNGVVCTAVSVFEFVSFCAEHNAQNLISEANPEHRNFSDQDFSRY